MVEWLERSPVALKGPVSRRVLREKTLFTRQRMGTRFSLELGKTKAAKKNSGTPPRVHHC